MRTLSPSFLALLACAFPQVAAIASFRPQQQSRYDRLGSTYEMAANSLAALSMRHPAAVMEAIAAWRQGAQARMPSGIDDKQARLALDWLYYDAALR